MTTVTLIRPSRIADTRISDVTIGCNEEELESQEERNDYLRQQNSQDAVNTGPYYYDDVNDSDLVNKGSALGRLADSLGKKPIYKQSQNVWGSDKLIELLEQPIGSPISLTSDEAREVIRLAAGRRPDLPSGKVYVNEVREILGHSLAERVKKATY